MTRCECSMVYKISQSGNLKSIIFILCTQHIRIVSQKTRRCSPDVRCIMASMVFVINIHTNILKELYGMDNDVTSEDLHHRFVPTNFNPFQSEVKAGCHFRSMVIEQNILHIPCSISILLFGMLRSIVNAPTLC